MAKPNKETGDDEVGKAKKKMAKLNSGVKSKSAKAKAIAGYMGKMAVDPKNC